MVWTDQKSPDKPKGDETKASGGFLVGILPWKQAVLDFPKDYRHVRMKIIFLS